MKFDLNRVVEEVCLLEGQPLSERSLAAIVGEYDDGPTLSKTIRGIGAEKDFNTRFIADRAECVDVRGKKIRVCHNCQDSSQVHELFLFIHGLGGELEQFEPLLRLVDAMDQRFLALDLPGFGKSDEWDEYPMLKVVETIEEIAAKFNAAKIVLVGHSMGCYLTSHFYEAYHKVHSINRIVLLSPPKRVLYELQGNVVQWGIWFGYKLPWLFDFYRSWFDQSKGLASSGIRGFFSNDTITTIQTYRKLWQFHNNVQIKSRTIFGYLSGWQPIQWDKLNQIWNVTATTLVVMCGDRDAVTPISAAQEIVESLPEHMEKKLVTIPDCGHHVCFDTPGETCRLFAHYVLNKDV
ncbi:hypothetical protein ZYGR_0U00160 [Zygosaccharomyces rouxii]|uniref:ZYRO0F09064p n=2 Tax=Zygosaccharomyces rouxii TaxID=4956 RepID=C5DXZ7_ZYGRC|nr:uncharacterized protein ZYRO0F09064g [Zygosaccharomyces rouxii]KAH9199417.1 Alpha/Beta hydrolase protein [Zygosaccharomyces rouxii]GAV50160.1 hypothetical protein ZYGR_0U00160 [Zygosaccharomyces rouxii]CAR28658.1 ZYRO0F09064p [Zygosaccharomyces rouxii]